MSVDFFENGLCFYCHLAKSELQAYADFHARTEHAWKREDALLQHELDALLKKYPDADQEDIVDTYAWDLHLSQYKYPDIHRSALVISLYVFLEDQLNGLCATVGESMETQLRLENLSGQGVERAFSYLSKVAQFDLGRVSRLPFVKGVNRLRNKMVHAGGVLPCDDNDKLNRFVRGTVGLRGKPGERVHVEPGFIGHLFEELAVFFDELDAEVQLYIKRAQQGAEPGGLICGGPAGKLQR